MSYNIIAGFPGVGKSYAGGALKAGGNVYKHYDGSKFIIVDMESSEYHWIINGDEKICNPEWPDNYINAILQVCHNTTENERWIPLISTHKVVLDALIARIKDENPIEYIKPVTSKDLELLDDEFYSSEIPTAPHEFYDITIIAPQPNDECKKKFINRYVERGSSPEFIKSLDENYYSYLKDLESFAYDAKIYFIDGYITDFIDVIFLERGGYLVEPDVSMRSGYSVGDIKNPATSDTFNFEFLYRKRCYFGRDISLIDKESIK